MNAQQPYTAADAHHTTCPRCKRQPTLLRSRNPRIDECGFESYAFTCTYCGASLAGIVDPFDDTLLISEMAA